MVVGAARAGTTWLDRCLREHPELCLPLYKELHFFDSNYNYAKGITHYESFFQHCTQWSVKGEVTPRYMLYKEALRRISENYPKIKIIVLLRDPVERALSQFNYFRYIKQREPEEHLSKAIAGPNREDYLEKSLYAKQISNILHFFYSRNVLIVYDFEIREYPNAVLGRLWEFLGVRQDIFPSLALTSTINSSASGRVCPNFLMRVNNQIIKSETNLERPRLENVLSSEDVFVKPSMLATARRLARRQASRLVRLTIQLTSKSAFKGGHEITPKEMRSLTHRYFYSDILELERLTGHDLNRWKK